MQTSGPNRPIRVIAITGGKGGVGKSVCSVNLALALAAGGQRVVLFDANLGLANINVLLGLEVKKTLADVVEASAQLADILIPGPNNIQLVPAAAGNRKLASLDAAGCAGIIHAFSDIADNTDLLLIDTAAGLSDSAIYFSKAAQEVIVVVCNEPTAIMDAYAFMQSMLQEKGSYRFHIIANMVHDEQEAKNVYAKICKLSDSLRGASLAYLGWVPFDDCLRKSVRRRSPLMIEFPDSNAAVAFKHLAAQIQDWQLPQHLNGNIEFFAEQNVYANITHRGAPA